MKVIIDTADDIQYKSFYVYALLQQFGHRNVVFSDTPFREITTESRNSKTMRFVIFGNNRKTQRFCIDCNDFSTVNEELYEWADIYGSINTDRITAISHPKLIQLCPSFAISFAPKLEEYIQAIKQIPYCHSNIKKHLGKWHRMSKRPPMDAYSISTSESGYLFHCSTLWQSDEWNRNDETVNLARASFIRAARDVQGISFEGGLVSHRRDKSAKKFEDCFSKPYPSSKYLYNTRRSIFVFNTPAYWNCHGWKLGEYMALGKAILSTPLKNELPAPLEHGTHIHFVENSEESIIDSVHFLIAHPDYCHKLEHNIATYWQKYGSPQATLQLLKII